MNRIKELRKQQNITQEQLGKECNVSSGAISLWESEKRDVPIKSLKILSKLFNCSIDYLLANETQSAKIHKFSPIEIIYNKLTRDRQNQLFDFARFLLDDQNIKKERKSLCA